MEEDSKSYGNRKIMITVRKLDNLYIPSSDSNQSVEVAAEAKGQNQLGAKENQQESVEKSARPAVSSKSGRRADDDAGGAEKKMLQVFKKGTTVGTLRRPVKQNPPIKPMKLFAATKGLKSTFQRRFYPLDKYGNRIQKKKRKARAKAKKTARQWVRDSGLRVTLHGTGGNTEDVTFRHHHGQRHKIAARKQSGRDSSEKLRMTIKGKHAHATDEVISYLRRGHRKRDSSKNIRVTIHGPYGQTEDVTYHHQGHKNKIAGKKQPTRDSPAKKMRMTLKATGGHPTRKARSYQHHQGHKQKRHKPTAKKQPTRASSSKKLRMTFTTKGGRATGGVMSYLHHQGHKHKATAKKPPTRDFSTKKHRVTLKAKGGHATRGVMSYLHHRGHKPTAKKHPTRDFSAKKPTLKAKGGHATGGMTSFRHRGYKLRNRDSSERARMTVHATGGQTEEVTYHHTNKAAGKKQPTRDSSTKKMRMWTRNKGSRVMNKILSYQHRHHKNRDSSEKVRMTVRGTGGQTENHKTRMTVTQKKDGRRKVLPKILPSISLTDDSSSNQRHRWQGGKQKGRLLRPNEMMILRPNESTKLKVPKQMDRVLNKKFQIKTKPVPDSVPTAPDSAPFAPDSVPTTPDSAPTPTDNAAKTTSNKSSSRDSLKKCPQDVTTAKQDSGAGNEIVIEHVENFFVRSGQSVQDPSIPGNTATLNSNSLVLGGKLTTKSDEPIVLNGENFLIRLVEVDNVHMQDNSLNSKALQLMKVPSAEKESPDRSRQDAIDNPAANRVYLPIPKISKRSIKDDAVLPSSSSSDGRPNHEADTHPESS